MAHQETPTKGSKKLVIALVAAPVLFFGGCAAMLVFPWKSVAPAPHGFPVSHSMTPSGKQWPLTVDRAEVICGSANRLMLGVPDASGTVYALNGTAKSDHKYADLFAIWKDDPDNPGAKIEMWLTTYGVEKCQFG